jgi:hypothetical protein
MLSFWVIALPLFAADGTRKQVQVTSTQKITFAPGGTVHVNDSYGYLTVEGWDQPEVEITVIKSTDDEYAPGQKQQAERRLAGLRIDADRRSETELVISTPRKGRRGVNVEYLIHAPREARLVIHHDGVYVLVDNMSGEIEATNHKGDIVLMLPNSSSYSIDARSKIGTVSSDFEGEARRRHFVGERYAFSGPPPSRRIYVRVGFGGITIKEITSAPESNLPGTLLSAPPPDDPGRESRLLTSKDSLVLGQEGRLIGEIPAVLSTEQETFIEFVIQRSRRFLERLRDAAE